MQLFDVYPIHPITLVKGSGSYVWDENETRYLDMYGGHAVISIGHAHPHFIERITRQIHQIGFYSNSVRIPMQEELADLLGKVSGKESYRLFLCNSGAEANENALKLASFHNRRKKVVAFTKSFHGRTSLALAVTDNQAIAAPINQNEQVVFLPFNDESALADFFQKDGDSVAAVIVEGIQGVGGIRVANNSFLRLIRSLCDRHGAVFIADSVQCGYGRTGKFYSHDYAEVDADIYTMAKGMGNGFPIGGLSIAPHIQPKHFMLGTTFGGNHLACAAALAVLEVMLAENLMEKAAFSGENLIRDLKNINGISEVRGRGLMIGMDLPEENKSVRQLLLKQHQVFTGEAKPNVIRLLPALNIPDDAVGYFIRSLQNVLQ